MRSVYDQNQNLPSTVDYCVGKDHLKGVMEVREIDNSATEIEIEININFRLKLQ